MTNDRPLQPELLREDALTTGPVTCLGMTFANDEERRAYFVERLREHLQDPTFRAIEGFPIGEDQDILALSDPPYYTACPNPFLPAIITHWQQERAVLHFELGVDDKQYHREPFTSDVNEGKGGKIYKAHTYHTKVPHQAIARYILHYTQPGDVVLDAFSGCGMTGVAVAVCSAPDNQLQEVVGSDAQWGPRKAVLVDLSPFATFLSRNMTLPGDTSEFTNQAKLLLEQTKLKIPENIYSFPTSNYVVWSQVLCCPECMHEFCFSNVAISNGSIIKSFNCPKCQIILTKSQCEPKRKMLYDQFLGMLIEQNEYQPVWVSRLHEPKLKDLSEADISAIDNAHRLQADFVPTVPMMFKDGVWGDMYRAGYHLGITHVQHFWTERNLFVLSKLWSQASRMRQPNQMRFLLTSFMVKTGSRMHNISLSKGKVNLAGQIFNTLQIPSLYAERNLFELAEGKINDLASVYSIPKNLSHYAISTNSASILQLPDNSIDYIFVDPPFGGNIMYSEMSFLYEAWLKVYTNGNPETIISKSRQKKLDWYREKMSSCFSEMFRVLKAGRWLTVVFHNSGNEVWSALQEALQRAGFVVADVRILDKGQGTYKQMTTSGAVEKDLTISAYKPTTTFEQQFLSHAGTAVGVWDFVHQHLAQVPPVVVNNGILETVAERQNYLLFDRMVAYHIQRGVAVPMGAAQFYAGLQQHFTERDGMYFLRDQVAQYDKARLEAGEVAQLSLFVNDEKSAITWLRHQLQAEPQSFQQIQPRFLQELHQARHEELPDLRVLLEENFLPDDEGRWYVPDPNRAEDLEKLRLRGLLREFNTYTAGKKKLRQFRSEAIRAGFAHAWKERDFTTIVAVAERLPEQVLQEDPDLLMYYDNASLRV